MSAELSELLAPWIAEHCATRAAERIARAERKKAERKSMKASRDAGLNQRHARKLARIQQQASTT
jgi:hypothetical protein